MSDTKFTPGPWHHDKDAHWIVRDANEDRIASVSLIRDAVRANAHLIAAAPDLYAALEFGVGLIAGDLTGLEWKRACRKFATEARAALAKARGQA